MSRFLILCSIYWAALTHGLDPEIITAQCHVESRFNVAAVRGNCLGISQVDFSVWGRVLSIDYKRMTTDVDYSLCKGLDVLKHYYDLRHGDIRAALNLYGNGYKHTSDYVGKIERAYKLLYKRSIKWH